jgi:hypothetical protein
MHEPRGAALPDPELSAEETEQLRSSKAARAKIERDAEHLRSRVHALATEEGQASKRLLETYGRARELCEVKLRNVLAVAAELEIEGVPKQTPNEMAKGEMDESDLQAQLCYA